ncbi:Tubulin/FtsZ family, GTPase domain [Halogranum gelatinilyticum]|uniref:Tubulin/FtsZ family, GTPase domain n=1 Tax=Halogranum gelatinilyticum TaxID=660521 RepID=A0A1G9XBS5_9EURY|nr:hypothetical protein [Halogranum gelatinilyticum]SDM94137.1 Tubulin/FtsZ family, GTPase domain [Halogranum gelatinilyticum]
MSDNSQTRCTICGQWEDDLQSHLTDEHGDQIDQIEEHYGAELAAGLDFDETERNDDTEATTETSATEATTVDADGDDVDDGGTEATEGETAETQSDTETASNVNEFEADTDSSPSGGRSGEFYETDSDYSGKWFVFGIGGAGNGILDSILLRRETLNHDRRLLDLSGVWGPGGLNGYLMMNTNDSELQKTYYVQNDREWDATTMQEQAVLGSGSGKGRDPIAGEETARSDIMEPDIGFFDNSFVTSMDVNTAQAVLLLHSIENGTGTGVSPVVAEFLRKNGDWAGEDKAMVSAAVIPNDPLAEPINLMYGLGGLSPHVDSIILFQNKKLGAKSLDHLHAEIDFDGAPEGQKFGHKKQNQSLVRFLEAFTLTSNVGIDASGDGLDVRDTYQPIKRYYPKRRSVDYVPATICAPVLNSTSAGEINESVVETLVDRTLESGKLLDFDPKTAWGGAFLLFGPEEKMKPVRDLQSRGDIEAMINSYVTDQDHPTLRMDVKMLTSESLDELYLWGVLWNPQIPALEQARDQLEMFSHMDIYDDLKKRMNDIDAICDHLGIGRVLDQ